MGFFKILKTNFYLLILFTLLTLICLANYSPHTFLTGWDTLHPEFNFPVNFQRLVHGVWRPEQGLGAVAGHSHMSDLPRVTFLWLEHFFLPLNFLRYSYVFLCLYLGTFGFYFLVQKLFKQPTIAFLGACLYLFNLGTLQQFLVPFEMFPTQWAFLPWVFLLTIQILSVRSPKKFFIFLFALANLLATPQAYAAHLWYTFFLFWLLFCLSYHFILKSKLRLIFQLTTLILLTNSFWLLPNLYYAFTQSQIPIKNLNNQLHTPEFLLANRSTGNLLDTSFLKGFYFNWEIYNIPSKHVVPLTLSWDQHLANPLFIILATSLFTLSLLGIILSFLEKNHQVFSFAPIYLVCLALLLNNTSPFRYFFDVLLSLPFLGEVLRFSFSKLSVATVFTWAIFTTYSLHFLLSHFHLTKKYFVGLVSLLLIYFSYPYFQGQLIHPLVRQSIPESYFQLYNYLNQQTPGRILTLPLHESTGWVYHNWGYQGSGFLWFGLKQSVLDRDFDRWSPQNEQSYSKFFNSLYSQDPQKLLLSLEKYQVKYLLWDQSIITTDSKNSSSILFKPQTQEILDQLVLQNQLKKLPNFGSIQLYELTKLNTTTSVNNAILPIHLTTKPDNPTTPLYSFSAKQLSTSNPSLALSQNQEHLTINSDIQKKQGLKVEFANTPHSQSYLLAIKSKYISGLPLRICLKNSYNQICTLYHQTTKFTNFNWDYYFVPTLDSQSGYELSLDSIAVANFGSQNQLQQIELYAYTPTTTPPYLLDPDKYVYLYQSYSPGWLALSISPSNIQLLSPHLLANSWANAWKLPDSRHPELVSGSTIYIFFWPQILEYLGFGLIILTFGYFIFSLSRTTPPNS